MGKIKSDVMAEGAHAGKNTDSQKRDKSQGQFVEDKQPK